MSTNKKTTRVQEDYQFEENPSLSTMSRPRRKSNFGSKTFPLLISSFNRGAFTRH